MKMKRYVCAKCKKECNTIYIVPIGNNLKAKHGVCEACAFDKKKK